MTRNVANTHRCPRRTCSQWVPDRLFCCWADWQELSQRARSGVSKTASMALLSLPRRAAIEVARAEWEVLDAALVPMAAVERCGAAWNGVTCTKTPGHENGPVMDSRRHLHGDGVYLWGAGVSGL